MNAPWPARWAACILAGLAGLVTSGATAADNPTYPIDVELAQSSSYRHAVYPDWDSSVLGPTSSQERQRVEGGVTGVLSVTCNREAWVSVIYYAETGHGYRMLDALPVPAHQQTQLTFPLPPGDGGITRLIVWQSQPAERQLGTFMETPLDATRHVPGLLQELWFGRSRPGPVLSPFDERVRSQPTPARFMLSRYPYARAVLNVNDTIVSKNCAVFFHGLTRPATDAWGSLGEWDLAPGSQLQLMVDIPPRRSFTRAELRLQGELAGLHFEPVQLRLEINGWRVGEQATQQPAGELELVSFDVSHNLSQGLNTLSLRSTGTGGDWLLRELELWLE